MARPGEARREIVVVASRMELDDVSGRVLFPAPQMGPWLPFVRFAETLTTGTGDAADSHAHRAEEVMSYVVEGRVEYVDDREQSTLLDPGAVVLLTAREESRHNLIARPHPRARWLSTIVRAPPAPGEPGRRVQVGTARSPAPSADGVVERRLVGPGAPVDSAVGLECADLEFLRPGRCTCRLGPERRAVAYVYEGSAAVDGRPVATGSGALIERMEAVAVEATAGTRLLLASAPRSPS